MGLFSGGKGKSMQGAGTGGPEQGTAVSWPVARDLLSGLVLALISVTYSLSYATLIFSGDLAHDGLALGAGAVLVSAGVCALVVAATSSLRFAFAGPDTAATAVVSVLAASVAQDRLLGVADPVPAVLATLALSTLLTGVVLLLAGALRLGRWIRFIPYPVVGGFLAASGWLLASGTVRVIAGTELDLGLVQGLLEPRVAGQMVAGMLTAGLLLAGTRRWRQPLAFPVLLLLAAVGIHAYLHFAGVSLAEARAAGWLLDLDTRVVLPLSVLQPSALPDAATLLRHAGELAAITAVTAVAILLNATGLEVESRASVRLDRELRAGGAANLLSGLLGGIVGNLTLNRSLLGLRMGASSRLSAMVAGAAILAVMTAGPDLLGYVPRPLLGGLLLFMALSLLARWLVDGWRRLSAADYVLVLAILFVILHAGYLAGVILGTVAACISFVVQYSRVRVVKRAVTGREYGSNVEWSPEHLRALRRHGERIHVLWLQGFLFFGTANHLLETVRRRLSAPRAEPVRWLLLDFCGVHGLDSSAVFSFVKLRHLAEERGLGLVLTGLRPGMEQSMRAEGVLSGGREPCRVFPDLDRALEWCEARLLEAVAPAAAEDRFQHWLSREMGDAGLAARLLGKLAPVTVPAGSALFRQGEDADAVYFIRQGRVSVLLETPHAPGPIRLRSMLGCTVVGEMGFYRKLLRTASVVADRPTEAYRLSADALVRLQREEPELAIAFHQLMVRLMADRLAFANQEVAALSR